MFCSRCGTEVQKATQFCPTCGLDLRVSSPVQAIATGDVTEQDVVRDALAEEYELVEELGRGGMAIVYRAQDKHLGREVAIKVLPFSLAFDAEFVERFTREARTSAQLEHPNIIPIYRVGKTGRVIYFVMKYLRGGSLSRVMAERKRLAPGEIRKLLADVGSALGYAHTRGIVHRDIKPDNIMFDEFGQCVVTDFGIAKAGTSSKLTGTGMSIGTPHYMSPEQARAQSIDGRSDLYSLGVLAYQALVGEVPYDGEDSFAIGYKHIMEPIPVPLLDTVDERRVFEIIKKLIAKDPFDRFQDADALLKALEGQPRESVMQQRRVSASQALLSAQSTTPLPAASVPLVPVSAAASNPYQSPRRPSESVVIAGEPPRRPAMRRSVAAPEPPRTSWVPWAMALLALLGFVFGGLYLYKAGVMGGPVKPDSHPVAAPVDSVASDSLSALDPGFLIDAGADPTRQPDPGGAGGVTAAAPVGRPASTVARDSGTLQFTPLPSGTVLFVDSRQVTQGGGAIRLPAGWHEIGISAPGYSLYIDSVHIDAGRVSTVSPNLSATSGAPAPPPGSAAELRRRALARFDCENPSPQNRFGQACYDSRPQPLAPLRVPLPAGVRGSPSPVVLIVKVSRQGRTIALRTRQASSDPAFTHAVESYAQSMQWTPALRDGQPVDGWTQAPFQPDVP